MFNDYFNHVGFIRLAYFYFSVYGTISISQMSRGQVHLDCAVARNSLILMNF
jgi:hypothetical protein